jgi:alkanesulfonate monooxygenase SsuD/methylene tetrahydromethanopterin reductase-like flavin-dependent oxidoreductase (luciferase family)
MMQRVGPAMKSGCIGRPHKVREQLLKYVDMGVELFLLKFVPTVDAVQEIRHELIEPLRGRVATAAE